MFIRVFIIIAISLGISTSTHGRCSDPMNLVQAEDSLSKLLSTMVKEENFSKKMEMNSNFVDYFSEVLELEGSFEYPFDSLKNIGRLRSTDGKIRIINWNLPLTAGHHKYFGFVQVKQIEQVKLFPLVDRRSEISNPQMEINGPEKWFGALYYHIETNTNKGKTFYTLLGFDFNNLFTSRRVIEVMSLSDTGDPVMGAPIFNIKKQTINRVIFEHSARVKMLLRFDEALGMIVFDHLSPSRSDLTGNYQFYGPDFSYDGFRFEEGTWVYYSNIDLRNPSRETPPRPLTPPEENPEPGFLYRSNMELRNQHEDAKEK
jgi:hypothetical protein